MLLATYIIFKHTHTHTRVSLRPVGHGLRLTTFPCGSDNVEILSFSSTFRPACRLLFSVLYIYIYRTTNIEGVGGCEDCTETSGLSLEILLQAFK